MTHFRCVRELLMAFVAFLALTCSTASGADGAVWVRGTFSSLYYNEEGGDLLGYEVSFIPSRTGMKALVQVAEGGFPLVRLVDAREGEDNAVAFDVILDHGSSFAFKGRASKEGLTGVITYDTGMTEEVFLPRKKSYWDL